MFMTKLLMIIAVVVLVMHGLVHLMGTAAYLQLANVQGLPYKTTLLGGRWNVGDNGIHVFGALWLTPAIGFVVAAVTLLVGWTWWQPLLFGITLLSLLLTVLDSSTAYAGVVINIVILALLLLAPRFLGRLAI
jgi:hypothetical protein